MGMEVAQPPCMSKQTCLIGFLAVVCACQPPKADDARSQDDRTNTTGTNDRDSKPECTAPQKATTWTGPFHSMGVWDFRGPLNEDRQLGDLVQDLVIEEAVNALGLPFGLDDEATDLINTIVDNKIRDSINESTTAKRLLEDPFYQDLSQLSADIHVESTIDLEAGSSSSQVLGREKFHSISAKRNGTLHELDLVLPVAALWRGSFRDGTLDIDDHSVDIAFSSLINTMISEVLGTDAIDAFGNRMIRAVDCSGLIRAAIGGKDSLEITLGVWPLDKTYRVSIDPLINKCEDKIGELASSVFGIMDISTGVSVGGTVTATDNNCDGTADVLASANFNGIFMVAGPAALAPRVYPSFEATREPKRAYADLSNSLGTTEAFPIRGRLVWESHAPDLSRTAPYEELFQDEIRVGKLDLSLQTAKATVSLGSVTADGEGNIDASISISDLGIPPGMYQVKALYRGQLAGTVSVQLLAMTRTAPVVRSDVDKTYLASDFSSALGLVDLLSSDATARETLPAMATLHAQVNLPLVFLTGSPRFFSRTLQGKFKLDQLHDDGLVTKPFKDIVIGALSEMAPQDIVPALKEQIGYKLYWLMRMRLELPATTPEILMGDDSEADHVVFELYRRVIAKELDPASLSIELATLQVAESWRNQIASLAPAVIDSVSPSGRVQAIYIRKTNIESPYPVTNWASPAQLHHSGTAPMAISLHQLGALSAKGLQVVGAELAAR